MKQNRYNYYIINTAGLQQNKTDFTIISINTAGLQQNKTDFTITS